MKIAFTRAMIRAVLAGDLDHVTFRADPIFNVDTPTSCPCVPPEVLIPRRTWSDGAAYDAQALRLARMFRDNFRTFESSVSAEVLAAGPNA